MQGVPRGVLQLVAVACMMLAAKQDEVWQCSAILSTKMYVNTLTALLDMVAV